MKKIAIIGAGISGLFIANLLKKNSNYEIAIYEKNTSVTLEEGYGVQLSVNSIRILNEIGFQKLENNKKFTPKKLIFTRMKIQIKYVNWISQNLIQKIASILL